ncbi:MAG TPA: hypothetical protein VK864_16470 [Longimicrobiales bacterium]|nr:hypothetical protein [Longimicrobiales bacterium]
MRAVGRGAGWRGGIAFASAEKRATSEKNADWLAAVLLVVAIGWIVRTLRGRRRSSP